MDNECWICYETVENGEECENCPAVYHPYCIEKWYMFKKTCPYCTKKKELNLCREVRVYKGKITNCFSFISIYLRCLDLE